MNRRPEPEDRGASLEPAAFAAERGFAGAPSLRTLASLGAALALSTYSAGARAEDVCAKAYEESQVARSDGRLRTAQTQLHECVRAECAEFIRTDCARWLSDVDSAIPSVVITATSGGKEVDDVTVEFDGEVLTTHLDGKSLPVDPGRHTLTFKRDGEEPLVHELTIREGEKNRGVPAEFPGHTPPPSPGPAPVKPDPPRKYGVLPHVLLGVGAAGVIGFTSLAIVGAKDRRELERTCSPRCADGPIDAVHTKFIIADASLAVAVVALATSGYLFWAASGEPTETPVRVQAGIAVTPSGGSGVARWSF